MVAGIGPFTLQAFPRHADAASSQIRRLYGERMRTSGPSSWRLALDSDQAAHIVLYIRDACRLIPSGPDVPPPLRGDVHSLELNLQRADKSAASQEWLEWWRRLIHVEGQIQLGHKFGASGSEERIRALGDARSSVFDPFENFLSLEESPLLRDIAIKTWRQGVTWFESHHSQRIGNGSLLPESVADSVIRDTGVSPERVRAAVLLFSVIGKWSYLSEPGLLLCSDEAYTDDSLFATKLKLAFESGIVLPLE